MWQGQGPFSGRWGGGWRRAWSWPWLCIFGGRLPPPPSSNAQHKPRRSSTPSPQYYREGHLLVVACLGHAPPPPTHPSPPLSTHPHHRYLGFLVQPRPRRRTHARYLPTRARTSPPPAFCAQHAPANTHGHQRDDQASEDGLGHRPALLPCPGLRRAQREEAEPEDQGRPARGGGGGH